MKKIYVCFLFLVLCSVAYGLDFTVIADTPYYGNRNGQKIEGELKKGEIISSARFGLFEQLELGVEERPSFYLRFTKDGMVCHTYTKNIIPSNTQDFFGDDILINYSLIRVLMASETLSVPSEMWVPSYYADVIRSNDRNTLLMHQASLAEWARYNSGYEPAYDKDMNWYDYWYTNIHAGMTMFFNAEFSLGWMQSFLIENIEKTPWGYRVHCFLPREINQTSWSGPPGFNWSLLQKDNFYDFLLYLDGDYMDIYVNEIEQKLGTLIKVKEGFIRQYANFISTNTCDISQIQWTRRADGSMDYPPPVAESGFRVSHATTDRLRLRDNPTTASLVVTTLDQGTEVQVLEIGPEATIDGVTSPWAKVRTSDGETGWCFSGYLEPLQVESPIESFAVISGIDPVSEMAVDRRGTSFLFVVIGGVVLVIGIIVFVFVRRKKMGRDK